MPARAAFLPVLPPGLGGGLSSPRPGQPRSAQAGDAPRTARDGWGQSVEITAADGSLLFGDDAGNAIWKVSYTGK